MSVSLEFSFFQRFMEWYLLRYLILGVYKQLFQVNAGFGRTAVANFAEGEIDTKSMPAQCTPFHIFHIYFMFGTSIRPHLVYPENPDGSKVHRELMMRKDDPRTTRSKVIFRFL